MHIGPAFGVGGQDQGRHVLTVMVHNSIIIDHILAIHLNSFFRGAGPVHAVADDNDDVFALHT